MGVTKMSVRSMSTVNRIKVPVITYVNIVSYIWVILQDIEIKVDKQKHFTGSGTSC